MPESYHSRLIVSIVSREPLLVRPAPRTPRRRRVHRQELTRELSCLILPIDKRWESPINDRIFCRGPSTCSSSERYTLTAAGRKQLTVELKGFDQLFGAIRRVLEA